MTETDRTRRSYDQIASHYTAEFSGELRHKPLDRARCGEIPPDAQANLARLLRSVDVKAVDERLGKEAGVLLGRAGTNDAVDASVVAVSATGDRILTGDKDDIRPLVTAAGRSILVVPC